MSSEIEIIDITANLRKRKRTVEAPKAEELVVDEKSNNNKKFYTPQAPKQERVCDPGKCTKPGCLSISYEDKLTHFTEFNGKSKKDQKLYLIQCIQMATVKRRNKAAVERPFYYIKGIEVCRPTLCNIFGISSSRITTLFRDLNSLPERVLPAPSRVIEPKEPPPKLRLNPAAAAAAAKEKQLAKECRIVESPATTNKNGTKKKKQPAEPPIKKLTIKQQAQQMKKDARKLAEEQEQAHRETLDYLQGIDAINQFLNNSMWARYANDDKPIVVNDDDDDCDPIEIEE